MIHPLDGEALSITITHLTTGLTGEASEVDGLLPTAEDLWDVALDDLLKKIEEAGGC